MERFVQWHSSNLPPSQCALVAGAHMQRCVHPNVQPLIHTTAAMSSPRFTIWPTPGVWTEGLSTEPPVQDYASVPPLSWCMMRLTGPGSGLP